MLHRRHESILLPLWVEMNSVDIINVIICTYQVWPGGLLRSLLASTFQTHGAHCARQYMSNGMIHVQQSFRETARALHVNKFRLVESWFLDTRSSGNRYIPQWNNVRPIRRYETPCNLDYDWSKIVPLFDVSAATGPCIQKSTFNQPELV